MCLQEKRHPGGDQTKDRLTTTATVSSVCFLVAVQGRVHRALASSFRPAELEVLLCVRRAGRPSVSLPPAFRPSLCLSLSPPPSSTVVLCTPGCGVTVHSTLLLACHPPWPSMGVRWEYLYAGTPVICSLVIF